MTLEAWGWCPHFQEAFDACRTRDQVPARVIGAARGSYRLVCEQGEVDGDMAGRLGYRARARAERPAVGDWVAARMVEGESRALVQTLLPRKTCFSRDASWRKTQEQVIAANVDTVFVVGALDGGRALNVRRFERYLVLASEAGVSAVIVLNKSDLCAAPEEAAQRVRAALGEYPVLVASALQNLGLDDLRAYVKEGDTVAFVGSSGVGKSALVNALLGSETQAVGAVRGDDRRGRHTTTRREILRMPGGGLIMDTPGMREVQLWVDAESVDEAFEEIAALSTACRFRDCRHGGEPGCAVQQALADGALSPGRVRSYLQLQAESRELEQRRARKGQRR